jgi:hypothetical protein
MAVRFDRPLEGQHATSLWLSSSLSTQAGAKHSLKAPAASLRPPHAACARGQLQPMRKWLQLC